MDFDALLAFAGRHSFLSLIFVGLTVAIVAYEISNLTRSYKLLGPAELTGLINREDALVVDIRPYADFNKGHIAGAKNVLMSQFDPESKLLGPAKSLPIVLVCQSGITAGGAAKRLKAAGFERVHVLDGGIQAWQSADLPLVKGKS